MDIAALRDEFPITRNYNFLNHASVAPLPRRAVAAINAYLQYHLENSYVKARPGRTVGQVRRMAAELIGAKPDEIALTKGTSEGLCFVANGLKWNAGDNVVTTAVEFPANVYPWMNVQSRGVQLRTIMEENGRIPIDNLIDAIDSHTRVVAVSAVQFSSGFRMNLAELGAWCQKRGVLFCVDAIQALGVLPVNVRDMHIDFLSAGGQKWMCGPEGSGIFFCDKELVGHLRPSTLGWRSMKGGEDFSNYNFEFHNDARRFEASVHNMAGIVGLGASLELLMEIGIDNITEQVLTLTDHLAEGARSRGYRVFSPRNDGEQSGIIALSSPTHDLAQVQRHLENEHRIITIIRDGRLRVSPHVYNTLEEIDHLLDALPRH